MNVALAIVLMAALQAAPADRARAEELARAGRSAEAIALFERIVEANPADVEAKLWVARLAMRLGRTADAEALYLSVLKDHPADVDARIGLGGALTRKGAWQEALAVLTAAEKDAGQNGDLFAALARAYRRGGNDREALEYFRRATLLAPDDPDVRLGFEGVARTSGHWIAFEGLAQTAPESATIGSATLSASVRAAPRLHLRGSARTQQGPDYSDVVAGGGFFWRAARTTTTTLNVIGGSGNTALPLLDVSAEVIHYAGMFEIGAAVRRMHFSPSDLSAISPMLAWDREPWRLDARYTFSRSAFDAREDSSGDHSVMLRSTWQGWRRAALQGTYAYGIESFEDLTTDRLGALGTTTLAGGARIDLRSLTRLTGTWEHQWRSNQRTVDRFTVAVTQSIP